MKIFGSISELVSLVFRLSGGKTVQMLTETQTNTNSTLYIPDLGAASAPAVKSNASEDRMVSEKAKQVMTNKTLTAPIINNATISGSTISLDDTDSAYALTLQSTSTLQADRTLTFDVNDAARTIELGGNLTLANNLSTSGNFPLTLTATASTNVTLPTTGTLVSETGSATLTGKTINDDFNTITNIDPATALKAGTANYVIKYDGTGAPTAALITNDNVSSTAGDAIAASKVKAGSTANKLIVTGSNGLLDALSTSLGTEKALFTDTSGLPATANTTKAQIEGLDDFDPATKGKLQAQLNSKEPQITGAATTITQSPLTTNRTVISDGSGKVAVSSTTSADLKQIEGLATGATIFSDGVMLSKGSASAMVSTTAGSADQVLRVPGAGGAPSFGQIDLSKSAAVTSQLPIANGGTGASSQQAAINALAGAVTANRVLRADGSNISLSQVALATDVSGTLPTANGGTGVNSTATFPSSGTVATTSNKLSAFALTTSTELAGVIDGKTGTSNLVFSTDPTLQNPTLNGHYLGSTTGSILSGTLTAASAGSLLRITSAANFSMIANPAAGRQYVLVNESSDLTIQNDTGATAANRIYTGTGADYTLKANSAVTVVYDNSISRWVLTGGGGAGGLATNYVTAGGITAVNNTHYLTNLSASGQTITLPAGVNGSVIRFSDAGEVWDTYPLTIVPATGEKIDKLATNESLVCDVKRGWVELSYNSSFGGWALMSLASTNGSAAGSGEVNAVLNPTAASGTTGWTNVTQVSSGSPLDPIVSSAFSIANSPAAESSTSGGYYSISSLAPSLKSKKLKVSFYFSTPATDVYRVSVYAGSTRLSLSSDASGATTLPANVTGGYFEAYFDSTTASAYSLNVTRTSGSTGACVITQVIVGPGINAQGAAISEWQSWTPTVNNAGSKGFTNTGFWRRVGSVMELKFKLASNSTASGAGSGDFQVNLPSGYTVPSDYRYPMLAGSAETYGFIASGQFDRTVAVVADSATTLAFLKPASASYYARSDLNVAYSTEFYAHVSIPIAEWASNGTVSLGAGAQVEYVSHNGTSTVYGPGGSTMPTTSTAAVTRTVTFQYPIQTDDLIFVEWSDSPTGQWLSDVTSEKGVNPIWAAYNSTSEIGWGEIRQVSSTQVTIVWRRYRTATSNWSASTDGYWRVRKAKASAPVGFGKSSPANGFGLVAPRLGQQALTVTSTVAGWSTIRAVGIYYQDQDGNHRLKFNMAGTVTSGTYTGGIWTISGVKFKNVASFRQAVSALPNSTPNAAAAFAIPNSDTIDVTHSSTASTNAYYISGDVELESKPTWA